MKPVVVVVSHTHWDREWYQPFEVFRLRLCDTLEALLDLLDRDPAFAHFMLDGQTICLDDVLALRPALEPRLRARIAEGRVGVGPWYVLGDEFLVGGESIVRNLAEGLRHGRRFGGPLPVGYLPDAFGHTAAMPRILRGFGIETAVLWRGVGDASPGDEWRWRAPSGAEVLCLFLPAGYGNAHALPDGEAAKKKLHDDLAAAHSRASVLLWMDGNDHQPADPRVPGILATLRAEGSADIEHASLERAAELVRARVDLGSLPVVDGELRRAAPGVPVLSGTWSARTWQKRRHDEAEALLARFCDPFLAFAACTTGLSHADALSAAWRMLLQCQPHDSICGCSIDEVHRDIEARLRHVEALGGELLRHATRALAGTATADFALHGAIAVLNPHPFVIDAAVEVELQRLVEDGPFRLVGPEGEAAYDIIARRPTDGPALAPAEWIRLRLEARALPPLGFRGYAIEAGTPASSTPLATSLRLREIAGGLEIEDPESGQRITHTFEDEGDRGDLYDFCPMEGTRARSSRDADLGVRLDARAIGRRVEIEIEIDQRLADRRVRARFDASLAPRSISTDSAFCVLERAAPGTHPLSSFALARAPAPFALGGPGLHEIELGPDGAVRLTLLRAVGMMSRGDLSTRAGHAGYHVPTPEAQGLGVQRYRYALAFGDDAVRTLAAGLVPPRALPLERGVPHDRPFLTVEPASVRLSIAKRSDDGRALIVRLLGPLGESVTARMRCALPLHAVHASDLDERIGAELPAADGLVEVVIPADDVVTLRLTTA